jgi:hypothetical protein
MSVHKILETTLDVRGEMTPEYEAILTHGGARDPRLGPAGSALRRADLHRPVRER